jgi:hypothetical protein
MFAIIQEQVNKIAAYKRALKKSKRFSNMQGYQLYDPVRGWNPVFRVL